MTSDENQTDYDTITDQSDSKKDKERFKFSDLFKSKNKTDSSNVNQASTDSLIGKEEGRESKKDSSDGLSRPDRIFPWSWNKMNREEQDSLLRQWDSYDKQKYKEKRRFKFTRKDVDVAIKNKKDRNLYEKFVFRKAANKPFKYRKKLITRMNGRYRKTMLIERLNKSDTELNDTISDKRRYQIVNNQFKREAKRETIRKNKMLVKYDRKEDRLRRRYELSENEKMILNKGRGMRLSGAELIVFNKAERKQQKFTDKLLKLRRNRSIALQNDDMRKHMKEKEKLNNKRDKARYSSLFGKKKKKGNQKFDTYEYPKRYEK
jgi:hypothetical protein